MQFGACPCLITPNLRINFEIDHPILLTFSGCACYCFLKPSTNPGLYFQELDVVDEAEDVKDTDLLQVNDNDDEEDSDSVPFWANELTPAANSQPSRFGL